MFLMSRALGAAGSILNAASPSVGPWLLATTCAQWRPMRLLHPVQPLPRAGRGQGAAGGSRQSPWLGVSEGLDALVSPGVPSRTTCWQCCSEGPDRGGAGGEGNRPQVAPRLRVLKREHWAGSQPSWLRVSLLTRCGLGQVFHSLQACFPTEELDQGQQQTHASGVPGEPGVECQARGEVWLRSRLGPWSAAGMPWGDP